MTIDVAPPRKRIDLDYRIEFTNPNRPSRGWMLFGSEASIGALNEDGIRGTFRSCNEALASARERSVLKPNNTYRVTHPETGTVLATFKDGERLDVRRVVYSL